MINLSLDSFLADKYKNKSQRIRVMTEAWVGEYIFCPACGGKMQEYVNNRPVADFYCANCREDYELKSKKERMGKKIVDGAYNTMIQRLQSADNPNFFFLNYDKYSFDIVNFIVIPKHFFVPDIIEKRRPLSATAKRAGWVGCNILLNTIPESGKIFYVENGVTQSKDKILELWDKTAFLKETKNLTSKGWLLEIMRCIERIDKQNFSLQDIYQYESYLKSKFPSNNNIQAKIRQQLQQLRDNGYLKFVSRGKYQLT